MRLSRNTASTQLPSPRATTSGSAHSLFEHNAGVTPAGVQVKHGSPAATSAPAVQQVASPNQTSASSGSPRGAAGAADVHGADPRGATTASGAVAASTTASKAVTSHSLQRPTLALTMGIMTVYKEINAKFCEERRRLLPIAKSNHGYDERRGHYIPIVGEEIASRYTVLEVLGRGSFGTVMRCCDEKYREMVAVKVIRSGRYFEMQGSLEAEIVAYLNRIPALQHLVVQLRKAFAWQGHVVLVFELLSFNLYQLIRCTKYNGVSLDLTRKFAYQLLQVLLQLEQHDPPIIHCDLKPENVLLRDPSRSGICVIDFGSSCYQPLSVWGAAAALTADGSAGAHVHEPGSPPTASGSGGGKADGDRGSAAPVSGTAHEPPPAAVPVAAATADVMPKYIQSRFYRSPEVILELGYTAAIDRWSLGCLLVELHTGVPLFPGKNEADMLTHFEAVLGPLPAAMIAASAKAPRFYHEVRSAAEVRPGYGAVEPDGAGAEARAVSASRRTPREDGTAAQVVSSNGRGAPATVKCGSKAGMGPRPATTVSTGALPPRATKASTAGAPYKRSTTAAEDRVRGGGGDGAPMRRGTSPRNPSVATYTLRQPPSAAITRPLEEVLGVHTGGPRGCRRGQPGHDAAAYSVFMDFVARLLQYNPRARMDCAEALEHPFLAPLRELEAAARQQRQQKAPSHPS